MHAPPPSKNNIKWREIHHLDHLVQQLHLDCEHVHVSAEECQTMLACTTVEPLNKGHTRTRSFVLYREVSFIRRLKCTSIIGIGTSRLFVLYREVLTFFIQSVLYRRFHCVSF